MKDIVNILNKCRQRDRASMQYVYNAYSGAMYSICLRYMKNEMDAQEALSNSFIKAFEKLETLDDLNSFPKWMKTITVRSCLNMLKKQKLDFTSIDDVYSADISEKYDVLSSLTTDEILNEIKYLPEGYRLVFNMYAIEGFKHKEIAETLDITEGTSKSQFSKARKLLQRRLEEKMNYLKKAN